MKRLVALMMCAVSLGAAAQFPNLPYNPDENGDGLIGVVDLQGLLANYGNEFSGAVISEDGESAITFIGNMAYPQCAQACKELPGKWAVPDVEDLGLVWDDIHPGNDVGIRQTPQTPTFWIRYRPVNGETQGISDSRQDYRCYCAAKQIPRVEYSYCSGGAPDDIALNQCINEKLADGWYVISGFPVSRDKQGSHFYGSNVGYEALTHASFWRWAE